MVRLTAILVALRSTKVRIAIGVALVVALAVIGVAINPFADDASTGASSVTTQENSVPPTIDWKAQEEKERLDAFLKDFGSGYDCPANDGISRIEDLAFCPDYTAILSFDDDKVNVELPEVPVTNGERIRPIEVTVKHTESCGNDGVKGAPVRCDWFWHIKWEVHPNYVPLGFTERMSYTIGGIDTPWYGPIGMGWPTGETFVSDKDLELLHIHAGDPKPSTPNQTADNSSTLV